MQRSVERVAGVKKVVLDLNTGRGAVTFEPGKTVASAVLWQAVKDSGFTPVRVEMKGDVYEGPKP